MLERRALVTGGSRGIGRAIACALTRAGYAVTIFGRSEDALKQAVEDGTAAAFSRVDVTDLDALRKATEAALPIAVLVNNAGGAVSAPFKRTDRDMVRCMLLLNAESAFETCRAVLPGMMDGGFGRIINVASTAGLKGYVYVSAYCAAKHALVGMTRALAQEVAANGITVNALCPGYTDTDLVTASAREISQRTGRSESEARAHFERSNPMGRLIRPEEVAAAAVWLISEEGASVTGQAIAIAGGEV